MDEIDVVRMNIERFRRLLTEERDEVRQAAIRRLLAEEERKLPERQKPAARDER